MTLIAHDLHLSECRNSAVIITLAAWWGSYVIPVGEEDSGRLLIEQTPPHWVSISVLDTVLDSGHNSLSPPLSLSCVSSELQRSCG